MTPSPAPIRCATSPPAARRICTPCALARAFTGRRPHSEVRRRLSRHVRRGADVARPANAWSTSPTPCPTAPASPKSVEDSMVIAPFNDLDRRVRSCSTSLTVRSRRSSSSRCSGSFPRRRGFWRVCGTKQARRGIVLIFDEVVTGFRFTYGGAQALYDVVPDLCSLGKIIGGGFPLAAIAGPSGHHGAL